MRKSLTCVFESEHVPIIPLVELQGAMDEIGSLVEEALKPSESEDGSFYAYRSPHLFISLCISARQMAGKRDTSTPGYVHSIFSRQTR